MKTTVPLSNRAKLLRRSAAWIALIVRYIMLLVEPSIPVYLDELEARGSFSSGSPEPQLEGAPNGT